MSVFRRIIRPFLGRGLFRLPLLRQAARLVRRLYRPDHVEIMGRRLWLNPADETVSGHIAVHGEYEPGETAYIRESVRPGDTVVDVGAHIGYFTLLFSSLVGPEGRVLSLEPDPVNFSFLRKTVAGLPEANVELHHVAAWKRDEDLPWHRSETNTGDHSLLEGEGRTTADRVTARRLDTIVPPDTVIDFLKMDVQGAEGAVLDGMERILQEGGPKKMLLEFMPSQLKTAGYDPEEIFRRLRDHGYGIRMISEYESIDRTVDSYNAIREVCKEEWRFVNLLCTREVTAGGATKRSDADVTFDRPDDS